MLYLGIDTSNYTTSASLVDENGVIVADSRLPVKVGKNERGIRQSDAVFAHIKNMPEVMKGLGELKDDLAAVGVSYAPRDAKGSYMPCFLSGVACAASVSQVSGAEYLEFSHQAGHIAAAVCTAGKEELLNGRFLAFHVSGGTTDLLLVDSLNIERVGGTLDLNAGQAIDRVGVMLGLDFPCGRELEMISDPMDTVRPMSSVKGTECNLSGLENRAADMLKKGDPPSKIAAFTLASVLDTLDKMCENAIEKYGMLPTVFAGGVTANTYIKQALSKKYDALFTHPDYSRDNAVGIAYLTRKKMLGI
ncbi:MAG: peptidase M22 [Clostridia bacterium]|nr:peptidase M22 [Clostridia bacterium]MBQ9749080.1 peptidase M22 [Clostridia bacterium]